MQDVIYLSHYKSVLIVKSVLRMQDVIYLAQDVQMPSAKQMAFGSPGKATIKPQSPA